MSEEITVNQAPAERKMRDEISEAFNLSKSEVVRVAIRELYKAFKAGRLRPRGEYGIVLTGQE